MGLCSQSGIRILCYLVACISSKIFYFYFLFVYNRCHICPSYSVFSWNTLLCLLPCTSIGLCTMVASHLLCQWHISHEAVTHQPKDLCLVQQRQNCRWRIGLNINNCSQILSLWWTVLGGWEGRDKEKKKTHTHTFGVPSIFPWLGRSINILKKDIYILLQVKYKELLFCFILFILENEILGLCISLKKICLRI